MKDFESDPDEVHIEPSDGANVFENDFGGITIVQIAEEEFAVNFNVDVARRVADWILRLAARLEAGRERYTKIREQQIIGERMQRAELP